MQVLVVGATGVVGRQLVPQLQGGGHRVVAASRSGREVPPAVEHRRLDLLDADAVLGLVRELEPAAIIHEATALSGLGNNVRRFDRLFALTNRLRTEGTASLIAAAYDVGVPRLLVQSFCGWPWAQVGGPVKEEDDPLDDDPAPAFRQTFRALRELEERVAGYPNGVVLRYGALYGPGTSLDADGAQLKAIRRRQIPLIGSADGVWSFVHVADAAAATAAALDKGEGTYNVVDDDPAPVRVWLPELAAVLGAPPPRRAPVWVARLAGGDGLVRMMTTVRGSSNRKARAELGWSPRYPSWREGFVAELAADGR